MSAVDIILVIVIILVAVYFISLNQDQLAIAKFNKERIDKNKADKERNKKLERKNITWTKKEKLAYIKNLISLSASDGSIDKSEQEVFLKILFNENLMPKNNSLYQKYILETEKMSLNESFEIIKKMSKKKKTIISDGIKQMVLADKKVMQEEEDYIYNMIEKTGIPEVNVGKVNRRTKKNKKINEPNTIINNKTKSIKF
jgi:cell division protein FtsI/penicillin-binding protein 2